MRTYRNIFAVIVLGCALGCSQSNSSPAYECSYEQDLPVVDDLAKSGSIFLFGERHGTTEAPSFITNFACALASETQEPIIVLFELPMPKSLAETSTDNIPISQAIELILAEGEFYWTREHDGRTSVAMMDAIHQILKMKEQGLNIYLGSIFPDENTRSNYNDLGPTFADKDTHLNRFFQEASQIVKYKDDFENVIVLSGKNHTRNHLMFFERMRLDFNYVGFVQQSGGGTEWNCQPRLGGCGVHPANTYRRDLIKASDNGSLVMFGQDEELFDGALVFKATTASPPFLMTAQH